MVPSAIKEVEARAHPLAKTGAALALADAEAAALESRTKSLGVSRGVKEGKDEEGTHAAEATEVAETEETEAMEADLEKKKKGTKSQRVVELGQR